MSNKMIDCTLISTSGENIRVSMPKDWFDELVESIQTKGKETVDLMTRDEEINGIYIGSKYKKIKHVSITSVGHRVKLTNWFTALLCGCDAGTIIDEHGLWYLVELDSKEPIWVRNEQVEFVDKEDEE